MNMNKWKAYKKSAQTQLTIHFFSILICLFIVSNLIFIIASIAFSYDYISKRADNILTSISSDSKRQSQDDWRSLADAYVSSNDEDALRLSLPSGSVYYSQDAAETFSQVDQGMQIKFLPGIYIFDGEIYYVKQQDFNNFKVEVALDSEEILGLTLGLLKINIMLNLIGLILGAILIYFKVGRWSKKLTLMTKEIEAMQRQLTVPKDPTEIRQVALAFNELLEQQRQAIEREKQFVANAAHDLKTPVAAIRGHVNLILRRGKQHPEVVESSLAFIDQESQRLQRLIQQLLVLNQMQENYQEVSVLDVSKLLTRLIQRYQITSKRNFELEIQAHQHLPVEIRDFEQLVQNLVDNALKYSQDTITVKLKEQANNLILEVADHGIGISATDKNKIFERFYRVEDSRSSEIEGSGIGLAIVKSVIEKTHGKIEVLDNKGGGSIFKVIWPLQK